MPRGTPVTDNQIKEIEVMLQNGFTPGDTAKELKIDRQTVYRIKAMLGGFNGVRATASHLDETQRAALFEQYTQNRPVQELMENFALTSGTFYQLLREHDIPTRTTAQTDSKTQALNDAVAMYINGDPVWKILHATGVNNNKLNLELHLREIPLRRQPKSRKPELVDKATVE